MAKDVKTLPQWAGVQFSFQADTDTPQSANEALRKAKCVRAEIAVWAAKKVANKDGDDSLRPGGRLRVMVSVSTRVRWLVLCPTVHDPWATYYHRCMA